MNECINACSNQEQGLGNDELIEKFCQGPTHLYKRVCPSVRPSVGPSVRRSVRRSGTPSLRREQGASYAVYPALLQICWHQILP